MSALVGDSCHTGLPASWWLGIVHFAIILLAVSFTHMLNHPWQIAQAMQEIFSY
jgi:hypothetical protein